METILQEINLKDIDKSKWKAYRFDEIAKNISERVDPNNTDLTVYIGLEHIDSESLHIRRTGTPDDVNGTKLRCYPGDIIFGRRRAYQRKAAISTFDGFCSAHSLVLRANPEAIHPKLLPFFMHSDLFMNRAVDISVGSLSPTINWGTLKMQTFRLPARDKQSELADLLWVLEEVIESEKNTFSKYKMFYERFSQDTISGKLSTDKSSWRHFRFGELGETYGGLSGKSKIDFGSGVPYITYMNVFSNSKIDPTIIDYVEMKPNEKQNKIKYGDILITGSSETPEELGMSSIVLDDLKDYYLNSFCFGFRLLNFDTLIPQYSRYLMRGKEVRHFMFVRAQGSTRFNLSKTTLKEKLVVYIPSVNEQSQIADELERLEQNLVNLQSKLEASKSLKKALINKIFG
jgi:type I restriction enzyme S subunit